VYSFQRWATEVDCKNMSLHLASICDAGFLDVKCSCIIWKLVVSLQHISLIWHS